ncbi:DNA-binding transcriptional regulator LsrR, DeoR family [Lentibacillus halodurans]|uniref:DNA-binding transcriptional regulator LsrR, DeoR family n=1 Tax=Lentibacillus halodurans TaxID=237679 RepID=A0A1I0XGW4_9BACI|nr:sugar-binding transcriptional regulator [Lentibacillus halodurans]SFB00265.1 DNA-binding transcriptional regulator LsrR, DeoR family [Lentibacillus halodurans]
MTITMKDRNLMEKVSKLYYLEGWTQTQICKKVGLSRPIISKLLKQAKEKNIVEIYIKDESVHTVELERLLEKQYNLQEAVVVSGANKGTEMVRRNMGRAASGYLSKRLSQIQTLGISWGKSIYTLVEEFQSIEYPHIHLVPLVGGMGQEFVEYHSNQLSFQLAQQLNASSSYLYAPAIADNADLKQKIVQSKDVASVLEEGKQVDLAIVGVGGMTRQTTAIEMGYLRDKDIDSLKEAGAEGDLNSSFFDVNGREVNHPINDRIIGTSLDEIKEIPEVMAIAEGKHKVNSLHIALKTGIVNVLVTDDQTAEGLLRNCSRYEQI